MFLDWKNQHYQDAYTIQGNLQIQYNPYQITNGILQQTRTNFFFLICMKIQKALNSQSNPEKEKWGWLLDFKLQSYTTQNSMVPAQK